MNEWRGLVCDVVWWVGVECWIVRILGCRKSKVRRRDPRSKEPEMVGSVFFQSTRSGRRWTTKTTSFSLPGFMWTEYFNLDKSPSNWCLLNFVPDKLVHGEKKHTPRSLPIWNDGHVGLSVKFTLLNSMEMAMCLLNASSKFSGFRLSSSHTPIGRRWPWGRHSGGVIGGWDRRRRMTMLANSMSKEMRRYESMTALKELRTSWFSCWLI